MKILSFVVAVITFPLLSQAQINLATPFYENDDWTDGVVSETQTQPIHHILRHEISQVFSPGTPQPDNLILKQTNQHLIFKKNNVLDVSFFANNTPGSHSVGYYLYQLNNGIPQVLSSDLLFPKTTINFPEKGATLRLDRAENEDIYIGFFVIENGWDSKASKVRSDKATRYSTPLLNKKDQDVLAEEMVHTLYVADGSKNHVIIGFEIDQEALFACPADPNQHNFKDYADIILSLQFSNNKTVVEEGGIVKYLSDQDGDGVPDHLDHFPNNESEAFETFFPSRTGYNFLAYEDSFPNVGDGDYNDFIMAVNHSTVTNHEGLVNRLTGSYKPISRGAGVDHQYKVAINVPTEATLVLRKYMPDGTRASEDTYNLTPGRNDIMIFESTMEAISDPDIPKTGGFANTAHHEYEQIRGMTADWNIYFASPVNATDLDTAPYDPYIVSEDYSHDIHLPGKSYAPGSLNPEGFESFIDANGYPWAMLIPLDWRYPLEQVLIDEVYPRFIDWRNSQGTEANDWYNDTPNPGHRSYPKKYYLDIDEIDPSNPAE